MDIKVVTVIGANGTLGEKVSAIFASFGNAKVYMITRDMDKSNRAKKQAALSVKAKSIENNLIPKTFENFEECISESDLIFESIKEDYETKKDIHKRINNCVGEKCIIATGTSGLSINGLAECYSSNNVKNFVGLHFFNPPYSLTLCEIIFNKYNEKDKKIVKEIMYYTDNVLKRNTIIVKDEPAFLGNRIGFQFINEALRYAEKYKNKGGIDYIDSILGNYTGRNMPPIKTADFVGLDIHKAIVDNIYNNTNDYAKESFKLPQYINKLINEGKLGSKTHEGLFKKDLLTQENLVYDIKEEKYRKIRNYDFEYKNKAINSFKDAKYREGIEYIINDSSEESKICMHFLLMYIIYSLKTAKEVSNDINDCDIAMSNGFNWIPPCALIDVLGGKNRVVSLCEKYLGVDAEYGIINESQPSKYDYRKFMKAIK